MGVPFHPATGRRACASITAALLALAAVPSPSRATNVLTDASIFPVPKGIVGSGNGTLDFILLTESAGGANNTGGGFNGDDGNTHMPTGNGQTLADESFITSFGELRDFFTLNFPDGSGGSLVDQIVIMVDVNETGGPQSIDLNTFDVLLNAAVTPAGDARNNPLAHDLPAAAQNGTNGAFAGGAKLLELDAPQALAQTVIGAGWPDHALFTGIDPFNPAFADADRFLLHWTSANHDNGGESVFLSGTIAPRDIPTFPEPAALWFLAAGAALLRTRR